MKKLWGIISVILAFGLAGCASLDRKAYYDDLVEDYDFEYFFPSHSFSKTFATIDDAYEFVNMAKTKFAKTSGKPSKKGLAAQLIGPAVIEDQPVSMSCSIDVSNSNNQWVDLDTTDTPLEIVIKKGISASIVFLVFYNNRAVSISDFRLENGYEYTSNSQYKSFTFQGQTYQTYYPVGWGIEKAFNYLKEEREQISDNRTTPDLPIELINYKELSDGYIQFYCNDPEKYDSWYYYSYDNPNSDANVYEIDVKKMAGYYDSGFGMLFCLGGPPENKSFYRLLINTNLGYSVWKMKSDEWYTMIDWKNSRNLKVGYGVINTLKVVKKGNTFTIFINGSKENSFTDNNVLSGQEIGLYTYIGDKEIFPNKPVDVRFLLKK